MRELSRSGNSSTAVATFGLYQGTTPCGLGRRNEGIAAGNSSTAAPPCGLYQGTTPCTPGRKSEETPSVICFANATSLEEGGFRAVETPAPTMNNEVA